MYYVGGNGCSDKGYKQACLFCIFHGFTLWCRSALRYLYMGEQGSHGRIAFLMTPFPSLYLILGLFISLTTLQCLNRSIFVCLFIYAVSFYSCCTPLFNGGIAVGIGRTAGSVTSFVPTVDDTCWLWFISFVFTLTSASEA